jgi:type IV pilus assembly protein PilE
VIDMNSSNNGKGFTLVELLVAVAIVGILASVALPGYQFAMRSARRAEAQGCLMELQGFMERFYTLHNCYKVMPANTACANSGTNPTLPFAQAPKDAVNKAYDLALQVNDGNSYTLRATPIAGTGQVSDGAMELDSTGARRWDKDHDGSFASSEQSWNR